MSETLRLKQITSSIQPFLNDEFTSSKTLVALDLVEQAVSLGKKVLIGTQFRSCLAGLERVLKDYNPAVVHGETEQRQEQVNKFQNDDDCHVFLASTPACREGLTLTAASVVICIDDEWSPMHVQQFIDRARRIGSEQHDAITVYKLIAKRRNGKDTIDAGILKRNENKAADERRLTGKNL